MTVARGLALAGVSLLASGCGLVSLHPASLTFRVDSMVCSPAKSAGALQTACSFYAYYGNVGGHSVQIEPSTTTVLDRTGRKWSPTPEPQTGGAFLLKPGAQKQVSWSVTLPSNAKPANVSWHGSKVAVQFELAASASAVPSAVPSTAPSAAPSIAPSSVVPSLTPTPSTAAPTTVAPTTTKAKPTKKPTPTKTTVKPTLKPTVKPTTVPPTTTPPPTTPPPPVHTTHRPPATHTAPPTTNSTNPGGGSGGIG